MPEETSARPIFILGIAPRSGTNFLYNLLRLHPDCAVPEPIWEDFVLEPSHLLMEYADKVSAWWQADPAWGVDESMGVSFRRSLGQAVVSFLASRVNEKRLLTKTPYVTNVQHFFELFPDAFLLILVRDGRDVVESGVRSFGWDRDIATRMWAEGAQTILAFEGANAERDLPYAIVRYEDLYADTEDELRQVLAFVNLDISAYDFDAARELPIWGSSAAKEADGSVHWRPVSKTEGFQPVQRWKSWSRRRHERFNWIAGPYLPELGYAPQTWSEHTRAWALYNVLVDANQRYQLFSFVPDALKNSAKRAWDRLF